VGVFLASAAPLAKASGCPPNRVNPNPNPWRGALVERAFGLGPCALTEAVQLVGERIEAV
jgi:hypothetical protein